METMSFTVSYSKFLCKKLDFYWNSGTLCRIISYFFATKNAFKTNKNFEKIAYENRRIDSTGLQSR